MSEPRPRKMRAETWPSMDHGHPGRASVGAGPRQAEAGYPSYARLQHFRLWREYLLNSLPIERVH